jgi:circadian clock protein KaiB
MSKNRKGEDSTIEFEKTLRGDKSKEKYILRLYVTGMSLRSIKAIENVKKICEENLRGRYELEVVDVLQQPEYVKKEQLLAAPTLIKKLPLPLRRLIGDMSNKDRVLVGLDLVSRSQNGEKLK